MISDPIGDMLTRIRNANSRGIKKVACDHSNLKENIIKIIFDEGFIDDYEVKEKGKFKEIVVSLKYDMKRRPLIRMIKRVSKPGNRIRKGYKDLKKVLDGQGINVLSTSKGLISDSQCRELKIGGEVICEIY